MRSLWSDLVYATRGLRKNPGFLFTIVLVLALGIGGNLAIFSIVNAALIRPLPFKNPDRLMVLWGNVQRAAIERRGTSIPDYRDWSDQNKSFEGLAAYSDATFTLTAAEERERVSAEIVGAKYFNLLDVKPAQGREFRSEETSLTHSSGLIPRPMRSVASKSHR